MYHYCEPLFLFQGDINPPIRTITPEMVAAKAAAIAENNKRIDDRLKVVEGLRDVLSQANDKRVKQQLEMAGKKTYPTPTGYPPGYIEAIRSVIYDRLTHPIDFVKRDGGILWKEAAGWINDDMQIDDLMDKIPSRFRPWNSKGGNASGYFTPRIITFQKVTPADRKLQIERVDREISENCDPENLAKMQAFHAWLAAQPHNVDQSFGAGPVNFVSNVIKTAGHAISTVTDTIQDATGFIVHNTIGQIPIVGGPISTVFDAGFDIAMAPSNLVVGVAIEGRRVDHAVLDNLKRQLHDFKQIAPYAQMVISVVPGIGTGVSGALSAGLALAEGQSITDALKAGLVGALPGGPLVKAAVTMCVETVQHVAKGDKINLQTFTQTAGGIASSALGLPIAAKNALVAGVGIIGSISKGVPLDKTLTDGAILALPLSDSTKSAMTEASTLSLDLAHGKKIDAAFTTRLAAITTALPVTCPLNDSIKSGLNAAKKVIGKSEALLSAALQSGLADTLVSMGADTLSIDTQKAIKTGIALGSGVIYQDNRQIGLSKAAGKLQESGIQLAKTSPQVGEARKLAGTKNATQGFDTGAGLTQHQLGVFDITTARNGLDPAQKIGFDMALALKVGSVANPEPKGLSPAAQAAYAITYGMQSYVPERKAALMEIIQTNPSAAVGATLAIKEIAASRESSPLWVFLNVRFIRLLKALRLRK